jgi:hypothetical protein
MRRVAVLAIALGIALGLTLRTEAAGERQPDQNPPPAQQPAAPPRDPDREEADRRLQLMDWGRAAEAYQQVVRRNPQNAQARFAWGRGRQRPGYMARRRGVRESGPPGLAESPKMAWEAAVAYAKLKRGDKTIDWLSTVVDGGLRSHILTSTSEFEFLRADPSFQALVGRAAANDRACSGAAHRGLDFWAGEWAIYDEDRVRVGTNRVAKTPDGCAYVETWSGTLGDGGWSLNYLTSHRLVETDLASAMRSRRADRRGPRRAEAAGRDGRAGRHEGPQPPDSLADQRRAPAPARRGVARRRPDVASPVRVHLRSHHQVTDHP